MRLEANVVLSVLATASLAQDFSFSRSKSHRGVTEGSARSALTQTRSCCHALQILFKDKIALPDTTAYNASLESYWTQQEANVDPACVFLPDNKYDISGAVAAINLADRIFPGKCKFAVRSGGHTPFSGAANIEGGVTIDLQNLKNVDVGPDDNTVKIGPGNRWGDVYAVLDQQNIATSGGRVSIVGTAGLITGGGVSFFTPRYGYVCDNVENFEVVLGSGAVVNANATSNPDLWRGLRGGSNNFGIVTEFTMRTFDQGDFWGGQLILDTSTLDQQFQAFEDLTGATPYDPFAALIFSIAYDAASGGWIPAHSLQYTKPEPYPETFQNFTKQPQLFNTLRIANLSSFTDELAASNPAGRRNNFITGTYKNSAAFMQRFYAIAQEEVASLSGIPNLQFALSFQPLPTVIQAVAARNGGNSLGLDESDGNLFNALLSVGWDDPADDELVQEHTKALFDRAAEEARDRGVFNEYVYLNYAAQWQDPINGYGEAVVRELKRVSRKFDPRGVFQRLVPGGFKVFE